MIQRIQTVFLAICAIIFTLFCFLPLKQITVEGIPVSLTAMSGFTTKYSFNFTFSIVGGFNFIAIAAAIIAIFCYKQRYLQIRFCYILTFISIMFLALLNFTDSVLGYSSTEVVPLTTNILLGASLVFALLASVFIKKDINLLKKADRIR
jgi:hypothetical protein